MATLDTARNYSPTVVGLLTQIGLSAATTVLCVLAFEVLRRRPSLKYIYEPRSLLETNPMPPPSKVPLAWLIDAFKHTESFYLEHTGIDSAMHVHFLRIACQFLLINSVLVGFILIPINWHASSHGSAEDDLDPMNSNSTLVRISIENVPFNSNILWAHLAATYFVSASWMYLLQRSFAVYLRLRGKYAQELLESRKGVHLKTVMVGGIPARWRDEEKLREYFEMMALGTVEKIVLVRKVKKLERKVKRREAKLVELEEGCITLGKEIMKKAWDEMMAMKNNDKCSELGVVVSIHSDDGERNSHDEKEGWWPPSDPSPNELVVPTTQRRMCKTKTVPEPSINFWNIILSTPPTDLPSQPMNYLIRKHSPYAPPNLHDILAKFSALTKRINYLRGDLKIFPPTSTAFVTFSNWRTAQVIAQSAVSGSPSIMRCTFAPEPRDVAWDNLMWGYGREYVEGRLRWWIVNGCIWALTIFWLFPISFILGLTTLESLSHNIGFLRPFLNQTPAVRVFISNILPTLLVTVFMALLPIVLLKISQQQRYHSISALEHAVLRRYYYFSVFNVLIVFLLGPTFIDSFVKIFYQPTTIIGLLASSLPRGSTFFLNYIAFNMSSHLIELVQLIPQLVAHPFLTSRLNTRTPRSLAAARKPYAFPYFFYYPIHLLALVVIQTYSVIDPLILWLGLAYFLVALAVFRHQHAHTYLRRYESGGAGFRLAARYSSDGLVLLQLTMCGLLILKGALVAGICILPLLALTIAFKVHIRVRMGKRAKFLAVGGELGEDFEEELFWKMENGVKEFVRTLWRRIWRRGAESTREGGEDAAAEPVEMENVGEMAGTDVLDIGDHGDSGITSFPVASTLQTYPDDSASVQTYDHPAIIEDIDKRLYLPINPSQHDGWDLDKCIVVPLERVFGGPQAWLTLETMRKTRIQKSVKRSWWKCGACWSDAGRDGHNGEGRTVPRASEDDMSSDDEVLGIEFL